MSLNLPPGDTQHVNPAVTPTWIFSPNGSAANSLVLVNEGQYPVYVGASGASQTAALIIPPSSKAVHLTGVSQTLYAASGVVPGAAAGTSTSSAFTAGSTSITMATTVPTALAAGATIVVGSTAGTGWEAQVVATTTATSAITFTSPLVKDHVASTVIYLATAQPGQLNVRAGVL